MSARHVIFDCDGVLIDSEWLACEVESELLKDYGVDIAPGEIARRFIGSTVAQMFAQIESDWGVGLPDSFMPRYQELLEAAFTDRLRAIDGIDRLLSASSIDRSVASNSPIRRVRHSLSVTGLDRHFQPDRVFSADMVARPKPSPDLHRHIITVTGADAAATVVIEDSPSGVAAARAAGLRAIGFTGASHCDSALVSRLLDAGAEQVFDKMDDVLSSLS